MRKSFLSLFFSRLSSPAPSATSHLTLDHSPALLGTHSRRHTLPQVEDVCTSALSYWGLWSLSLNSSVASFCALPQFFLIRPQSPTFPFTIVLLAFLYENNQQKNFFSSKGITWCKQFFWFLLCKKAFCSKTLWDGHTVNQWKNMGKQTSLSHSSILLTQLLCALIRRFVNAVPVCICSIYFFQFFS